MNGFDQTDHPSNPALGTDTSGSVPPPVVHLREIDFAGVAPRSICRRFPMSKKISMQRSDNMPLNRLSEDRRKCVDCARSDEDGVS
jgi:hypothetical protein